MYLQLAVSFILFSIFYNITSVFVSMIGAILFFAILKIGFEELFICFQVFPREIFYLSTIIRQVIKIKRKEKKTLGELFEETVRKYPNKTAIINAETDEKITFQEFQDLSNKFANIFHDAGFKKGDIVAFYLHNRLEYLPLLLGLSNLGVISALINTNLKGETLKYSLETSKASAVVSDRTLEDLHETDENTHDRKGTKYFVFDNKLSNISGTNTQSIEALLINASTKVPSLDIDLPIDFPVSYIFTSGTSGYPKAVVMPRKKYLGGFYIFEGLTYVQSDDIVYNTLPMYHASGGLIFFSPTFAKGSTMVFRKKFSASHFFTDCINYKVTYSGYVGELWRYLLAAPPNEFEKQHCIKRIVGNGLRRPLFQQVKKRFNIPIIHEFYGATEANMGCINNNNTDGAVGFRFKCFPFLNMWSLVQVEQDSTLKRSKENGLAIECQPGQPGTLVAIINKIQVYYGYTNNKESSKKVAHDIFKKGDSVFLSGDILETDKYGYLYFLDRIGDTYRWKGENVATTEVENRIAASSTEIINAIVFPVKIPNTEGTTGMAYLQVSDKDTFNLNVLIKKMKKDLPDYAIPMFLKIGKVVETTSTLKYIKTSLKEQAFDPFCCLDDEELFMYDSRRGTYRILDVTLYQSILNGELII